MTATGILLRPFGIALLAAGALAQSTSFEEAAEGPLRRLETPVGSWSAKAGHAEITRRTARSGDQALRIHGGKARAVELVPALAPGESQRLSFWAERWTRRDPFSFRVEGYRGGRWRVLHDSSKTLRIGGFHARIDVDLSAAPVSKLRLVCTAPENSGVLLDDFQLVRNEPMRVIGVRGVQAVTPILVRNEFDPLLQIEVEVEGNLEPLAVVALAFDTSGTTDLADLGGFQVTFRDTEGTFGELAAPAAQLCFRGRQVLEPGVNRFWLAARLRDSANIDHRIAARCTGLTLGDGSEVVPEPISPLAARRLGVALRRGGDDDSKAYRIPGLVTTNEGTLIAVYDIRWRGMGDLPGDIDVGMSRSTDGGRTWEPMRVIMDMGRDPEWRHDGIGDPAVLVDRETNAILVAATWSHGNRSWRGSGPGMQPAETGQFMIVESRDDGRSWSRPRNITPQIKDPTWCFLLQGPGRGITMADGTLVFPAQYQDTPQNRRLPRSTIIYSKDRGASWQIGTGAYDDTTESAVVELPGGQLMLNCRYNRQNRRVVMTSADLGATWSEHVSSRAALPEPRACMASLIAVPGPGDETPWLLFSNPAVESGARRRMTIKLSRDLGVTWPAEHHLLLDEGQSAGYSCLSMIDERTIGILYEGSRAHMTFQRIPLADLLGASPDRRAAGRGGDRE